MIPIRLTVTFLGLLVTAWWTTERPMGEQVSSTGAVLYEGALLIPGDASPPIESSAFLVRDGVIVAIGIQDQISAPRDASRVDLTGKTVIPTLVNLHGHVGFQQGLTYDSDNYTRENIIDHLDRYAYYGVGVIVSLGTDVGELWTDIQRSQQAGTLGGTRLFTAGRGLAAPNAGPGAAALRPSAYGVTNEEQGRQLVRTLAALNVAFIKIWVDDRGGTVEKLDPMFYRAIIDESHKLGLQVIAHVFYHADAEDLVKAGVDGFAHLVRDREMDDTLVAAISEHDIFVMPNLGISERGRYVATPNWLNETALKESVSSAVLSRASLAFEQRSLQAAEHADNAYRMMERSMAKLVAADAPLVLGSDSGVQDHFYGFSAHRELELMVAAGLTAHEAIMTATSQSADRLGLNQTGRLHEGTRADFLVLNANPLDDITNTRDISGVYLNGIEIDRSALRNNWTANP